MNINLLRRHSPLYVTLPSQSTEDLEKFAKSRVEKTQPTADESIDRVERSKDDSERSTDIGSMVRAVKEMLEDDDGDDGELLMEFILARFLLRHQSGGGSIPSRSRTLSGQRT